MSRYVQIAPRGRWHRISEPPQYVALCGRFIPTAAAVRQEETWPSPRCNSCHDTAVGWAGTELPGQRQRKERA